MEVAAIYLRRLLCFLMFLAGVAGGIEQEWWSVAAGAILAIVCYNLLFNWEFYLEED
jgi:hypothetical protein